MATTDPAALPGEPVDPAQAQGAQIPLVDFHIPEFPPQAQGLNALTLTSDIKVDEYQAILSKPFTVPELPRSIESLTLELFSLGYPPGFLTQLATRLPNLKSVVIYSQLFAGITDESRKDAIEFFKKSQNLRALHLLDVFAKEKFFAEAGKWLRYSTSDKAGEARRGLMFLEVSYTYRHEDEDFLHRVQATELPDLVGPGLISCSFNVSHPEDVQDDEQDPTHIQGGSKKEGIMAFNKSLAPDPVSALTKEEISPEALRALNLSMYTLTVNDLETVLKKQKHLMVLSATLEVEPGEAYKKKLIKALEDCESLEQVEIVANPTLQFFMEMLTLRMQVQNPRHGVMGKTFPSIEDLEALSSKLKKLSSFKANILKTTSMANLAFEKQDGKWIGGVSESKVTATESAGVIATSSA